MFLHTKHINSINTPLQGYTMCKLGPNFHYKDTYCVLCITEVCPSIDMHSCFLYRENPSPIKASKSFHKGSDQFNTITHNGSPLLSYVVQTTSLSMTWLAQLPKEH